MMKGKKQSKYKIMVTFTLTKEMDGKTLSYRFFTWLFQRLFILNIKMDWLNNYNNYVCDKYDIIDTLGNSGDVGKFIETYSCELYYRQTIKTRFFTINLIDM